jgi:hypothetical protein
MRYLATTTKEIGVAQVLLVENPQDERMRGCIVSHIRIDDMDGPPVGGQVYQGYTIEQLMEEFENDYDVPRETWKPIPDQLPGCDDAWIGPVRPVRDAQGRQIQGVWQRLVGDQWIGFSR